MASSKNVRLLSDSENTDHQRMRSDTTNTILEVLKEKPPEDAINTIRVRPVAVTPVSLNDIQSPIPAGSRMYQPAIKPTIKLDDTKDEKRKKNKCCNS